MYRKETYATSGTRIKLRFFGGWDYKDGILADQDWVKAAYAGGTTMGADLPAVSGQAKAPSFVLWAVKDPTCGQSRPHPDRQGLVQARPELREDL